MVLAAVGSTPAAAAPTDTVVQSLGDAGSVTYSVAGAATLTPELSTMGTPRDAYDGSLASGTQAARIRTVPNADCNGAPIDGSAPATDKSVKPCSDSVSVRLTFTAPVTDPVVHLAGLALGAGADALLTSSADLSAVDGSALTVTDARSVGADRTGLAACTDGTACGSVQVNATVESVTFTVAGTDAASSPVAVQDLRVSTSVAAVGPAADLALGLKRTASPGTVDRVGQQVTYTLTATNQGDVPLSDVAIVDELDGLSDLACTPAQPATLAPGKILRCTGTLEVTQAVLDFGGLYDVAQVFGEALDGDPTDPSDDIGAVASGEVRIAQSPALRLALAADTTSAAAGDTVTYTFVTTNRGNVTLTRVAPSAGAFFTGVVCPSARTLAPGASLTCTATHVVTDAEARAGTLTARGLVRTERPFGDPAVTADDVTARATVVVTLTKSASSPRPSSSPTHAADPTPEAHPSAGPTTGGTAPGVGSLPDTGGPSAVLIGLGVLLAAGGAILLARRRRS